MFNAYYEQELASLRTLAAEFATRNPAIAPLLGSGVAPDPDVERLLEGVAFLTGLMRQRLDDEFPEFIQELAQLLFPQYLRPLPCMSMLQFTPKGVLGGTAVVDAGTEVASIAIDGVRTIFRTAFPVSVEPVTLTSLRWDGGEVGTRSLLAEFSFDGISADAWHADRLRFYLGDGFSDATRLLLLLTRYVREIRIGTADGPITVLQPDALEATGLRGDLPLLPYPDNAHPAFCQVREYFAFAEKFLFVDLNGISKWHSRGDTGRFYVRFVFSGVPSWAPEVRDASLVLNATPVVNLFSADAHPIKLDHRHAEHRIQLSSQGGKQVSHIYEVESVTGYRASQDVSYQPFGAFALERDVYHVRIKPSLVSEGHDHYLAIPYNEGRPFSENPQTLSVRALCTHGKLPEGLRLGDISEAADTSPARLKFRNIRPVTQYRAPIIDEGLLWRILSHLTTNHLRLGNPQQLRNLLSLQLPEGRATQMDETLSRRIQSIEQLDVAHERRFVRGLSVEGSNIELVCRGDHFVNLGGLFLFGSILDEFFAGTTSLNTFTALSIRDSLSGERLQWPPKIGRQRLL
ncbi:type VI secretion system baseplate subunit TssF [Burkholderia sp. WSM2232]|uniref:type VI secretion system baseplate subunit TssF n=1 Tax=Burkholderia sp. WSM2232 TaxID=944436 RepID=UPI00040F61D2|nr:type VI secretion system baseplate subunit TssF [Burkholderia sp. WSM2232]